MKKAHVGDTVVIDYVGKLENGEKILSSSSGNPVFFKLGQSDVIDGIQDALVGMEEGEKKTVTLLPEKAFGNHKDNRVLEVDKKRLPEAARNNITEGRSLELKDKQGGKLVAKVNKVTDDKVVLDTNHPFAGQSLVFDLTLLEVK